MEIPQWLGTLELVWSAEGPVEARWYWCFLKLAAPKKEIAFPTTAFIDHWEYILSEILTYILHMHPEVVAGVVRRTYCRSKVVRLSFFRTQVPQSGAAPSYVCLGHLLEYRSTTSTIAEWGMPHVLPQKKQVLPILPIPNTSGFTGNHSVWNKPRFH